MKVKENCKYWINQYRDVLCKGLLLVIVFNKMLGLRVSGIREIFGCN